MIKVKGLGVEVGGRLRREVALPWIVNVNKTLCNLKVHIYRSV